MESKETNQIGNPEHNTEHESKRKRKRKKKENALRALVENIVTGENVSNSKDYYDIYGPGTKSELELKLPSPPSTLKIRDVQDLILWIIGEGKSPKWVFVKNKPLIPTIVMVVLESLSYSLYSRYQTEMPFLNTCCQRMKPPRNDPVITNAPGSKLRIYSSMDTLFTVPKKKEKSKKKKKSKEPTEELPPINHYLLTEDEVQEVDFPITVGPDWIELQENGTSSLHMVSIDCEMCWTAVGLELTRVSVVDESLKVIYDTYVMPATPIVDYVTRYSGVTAEKLEGVTTTLRDVQRELQRLLSKDVILVGHSLENDLKALKLVHKRVIDTAIIYPHSRGGKFKNALRFLVQNFLGRTIQETEHDSITDATACMELVQLKQKNGSTHTAYTPLNLCTGPQFGGSSNVEDGESIFFELANRKCTIIDKESIVKQYSFTASGIPTSSDQQTLDKLLPVIGSKTQHFIFAQFHGLTEYYEDKNDTDDVIPVLKQFDQHLETIYDTLTPNSLFIVMTGSGNLKEVQRLYSKKSQLRNEAGETWGAKDEEELEKVVQDTRKGMSVFCVK